MDMSVAWERSRTCARRAWTPRWLADRPRPLRIALRALAIILLTLFAIWLMLFVTKGRFLERPFESIASSSLEREVEVGGDFQLYFAPFALKFRAEKLTLANTAWAGDDAPAMFDAALVDARIAPFSLVWGPVRMHRLTLDGASADLRWNDDRTLNNWTFGEDDPDAEFTLPRIKRARVEGTEIAYRDPVMALMAELGIETVEAEDTAFANDVRFSGSGTTQGRPFTLSGRLLSPNETVTGGRNKLALNLRAGATRVDVYGTLPGATEIEGAELAARTRGPNMALLFDFIGVAVPESRAYDLRSNVTYTGAEWRITDLAGTVGNSDLAGSVTVGMPDGRIDIRADLRSNSVDAVDLGPFFGYNPERVATQGLARSVNGRPRLLPDGELRVDAIRQFDAHIEYTIGDVKNRHFPVSDVSLVADLKNGVLQLNPVRMNLAGGGFSGNATIDATGAPVKSNFDIRLSPTNMGRLLSRFGVQESGTTGTMSARMQMRGVGDSISEMLGNGRGRIAVVIPQGTLWARNAQLAELDLGTFVQLMFEDEEKEPIEVNCGLVGFTVRDGVAAADPILIDTKKNVILGRGGFSFKNEALDLAIRADGKDFSLFSGQSPIGVGGYLAEPDIDPISGQLMGRAGAGIGLAVVATPVAGLLTFIDPGDAKAAACGPVLAGANARAQRTEDGEPRDDVGRGTTAKSEDGKDSAEKEEKQRKKFLGIF